MKVTATGSAVHDVSSSQAGSPSATTVKPIPAVRNRRRDNDKEYVDVPATSTTSSADTQMTSSVTSQQRQKPVAYTQVTPSKMRNKTALKPPANNGCIIYLFFIWII